MSVFEDLQEYAIKKASEVDVKVYVKTDITPEVLAYDSTKVDKDTGEDNNSGLLKYKVRVTSGSGKELFKHGEAETNIVKSAIVYGGLLFSLFVVVKGLKGTYVTFKK